MKKFDKLKQKILKDTGWELYDFQRTYAGRNQLASGAASWFARVKEDGKKTHATVEGWGTATQLLRAEKLEISTNWRHIGIIVQSAD